MPAATAKIIKRRIKSVKNTRKITKAMELVAASKMRRAVQSVLGTRPYAQLAWNVIRRFTKRVGGDVRDSLLLENAEAEKSLIIVFATDRGLAGAFNANIAKRLKQFIAESDVPLEAIAIGRRASHIIKRHDIPIVAAFEGLTNKPRFEDTSPIRKLVLDEFEAKTYRKVYLLYTDFVSALSQKPELITLLPLTQPSDAPQLAEVEQEQNGIKDDDNTEYLFEPNPRRVLNVVLPRLVEIMIYQALLESAASEHSARMMAMKNASDSAGEMLDNLTFTYNQIRQAGITQEIAEISSGAAAIQ